MNDVIHIRFHEDLGTSALNKLRYRMELAAWRAKWRKAEAEKDHAAMDRLDCEYNMVGLP